MCGSLPYVHSTYLVEWSTHFSMEEVFQYSTRTHVLKYLATFSTLIEDGHCQPRLLIFLAPKVPHKWSSDIVSDFSRNLSDQRRLWSVCVVLSFCSDTNTHFIEGVREERLRDESLTMSTCNFQMVLPCIPIGSSDGIPMDVPIV